MIAVVDDRAALLTAREQALAFVKLKTWKSVWDMLIADYLTVHRVR